MDEDTTQAALHQMKLLEQEWLADEAAQAQYKSWLDSIYRTKTNEPQQSD
jgi:hypothetical protein